MADEDLAPGVVADMTEALERGRKLQAIRIYRDSTGKSLMEAKEFVDQLIPSLVEKDPERFAGLDRKGAGCSTAVLLFATAVCSLLIFLRG